MSNNYKLKDDGGASFKKIMKGKRWVGRVCQHADGSYLGVIGNMMLKAQTEVAAFEGITARFLGYANASQMKARGRTVRIERHESKARVVHAVEEMMNGNFEPLDVILGLPKRKRFNPNNEAR